MKPTPVKSVWVFPTGDDLAVLRSLVPDLDDKTPDERAYAILLWCSRCFFTGVNQKDALLDGKQLTGGRNEHGPTIARWLIANANLNSGMGPTIDCGALAALFIALCAAWGIYAREVAASYNETNDITAEYWSVAQGSWVHCVPYTAGQFEQWDSDPFFGSYQECTKTQYHRNIYTYNGVPPVYRPIDYYAKLWAGKKFVTSAVILNGNAYAVQGHPTPVKMQVWVDHAERPNAWRGVPVTQEDLYPDMSKV